MLSTFENRELRIIFGHRGDEVTRGGKMHDNKLHNLHSSPDVIWVIESSTVRCAGYVARKVEIRN
jgi:hypothetical protein